MKRLVLIILLLIAVGVIGYVVVDNFTIRPSPEADSSLSFIKLPPGFTISVFAENIGGSSFSTPGANPGPRLMALQGDDTVYVTVPNQGAVYVLRDTDGDGKTDTQHTLIDGLNKPHGIAFDEEGSIYIAEEHQVMRARGNTKEALLSLPTGGHSTRTVKIINGKLYVATGSSCNVCDETDPARAAIQECDLDGKNCSLFASGLRNTVDFIERNGTIYGTDNGRDNLGDDLPPDEINIIEKDKDYGWPLCYGKNIIDTEFAKGRRFDEDPCALTEPSFIDLPAHSAPLGLAFYEGDTFPNEYKGDLFVAYHGSWNRSEPTGYKIVSIDLETKHLTDFAAGWLGDGVVRGRPVGIINYKNGLLVSDDNQGKIYFIQYTNNANTKK